MTHVLNRLRYPQNFKRGTRPHVEAGGTTRWTPKTKLLGEGSGPPPNKRKNLPYGVSPASQNMWLHCQTNIRGACHT